MSRRAQVEEVTDSSSGDESDPMEMDLADFARPNAAPSKGNAHSHPSLMKAGAIPSSQRANVASTAADLATFRRFQTVYPVYFDKARSRAQGRRVGMEHAVENPLAREMAEAVQGLGLRALFEADKTHPKDWANPGRVKVLVKENGRQVDRRVNNKHHLYILIAKYLLAHPTTPETPLRLRIAQLPPPDPSKPIPTPAIPRGWKMGTILPLHSPALSGGGISEDFLKEMMSEMQGKGAGGAVEGGGGGKKKDKRKVKA